MRAVVTFIILLALAAGGWFAYQRATAGPPPVWVDLGSLLRHPPGRETLYQYASDSTCYRDDNAFLPILRLSSYNKEVERGALKHRLTLYLRNADGDLVALVMRDPRDEAPLTVNDGEAGFAGRDGTRWDSFGRSARAGVPPLTRLATSTASAHVRVNARAVTCPEFLPERRAGASAP